MKINLIVVGVPALLLISCVCLTSIYSIPQLIPSDYDCEKHPGFISNSKPAPFETSQHYVNRHGKAVKRQIEEVCG